MAELNKAQKLAAARKKLKEYQQKSHKLPKREFENENVAVSDALSSSTHSSVNDIFDPVPLESVSNVQPTQVSLFHNYFIGNQSSNFFDNMSNYNSSANEGASATETKLFDNTQNTCKNDDIRSIDYPEIKSNDIFGYFKTENVEHPSISSEDAKKLTEYMETPVDDLACPSAVVEFEGNTEELFSNHSSTLSTSKRLNSNTESLRQLSSQITELIKDEPLDSPQHTNELEQRNQELAALLEEERLQVQKYRAQLNESQNRVSQLELESQQSKVDYEHRLNRELGPLQEQLQYHAQTVGILIGEKTELSTALSQSQLLAKQKVCECEELQGRLKTSRSRVADLENEVQVMKMARMKLEQHSHEEELEKLKKDYQELKDQKEEVHQDLLELREKLNVKTNENLVFESKVQDVTHQLSLAQVKIEQLTAVENLQTESQIELLTQQKLALEKQLIELSQALKATGEERDQASVQYQRYVQQLNDQVASLGDKLVTNTIENENLSKREQGLVQHIGELEKHLQIIQEERINFATNRGSHNEVKKELDTVLGSVQSLQMEKAKLEDNYEQIVGERDDLLKELESKKEIIERLENQLQRIRNDQPDSAKLLAAMESDKVAAARAVTQNSELKQQLEEMQQAFVRMSNDKLDLTERLTSEEYRSKELIDKLNHTEHQLHVLTNAITIKDNELIEIREMLINKSKQILQQDQLTDRLRHYEAQDGSSHALQGELQKSQDQIHELIQQNLKLQQDLENVQNLLKNNQDVEMKTENQNLIDENQSKIEQNIDSRILDKELAMKRLEEKFTYLMTDIANLTEEKQRLEHMVMQLQGETETIGEYIALYQHQRGILKQRTWEKEEQFKRLTQDHEKLRSKFDMLYALVRKWMQDKGEGLEQQHKSQELCSEHAKIQQEIDKITDESVSSENNNVNTDTAEKIIALLTELKSSNFLQPSETVDSFHPCPLCSGQLLIV